jgi:hypothetical protein
VVLTGSGHADRRAREPEYIDAVPYMHRCLVIAASVLMLTACSGRDAESQPGSAAPSSRSPASASAQASAFCLNLNLFQIALTLYRADVGKTVRSQPLDLEKLSWQSANVARIGEPMRADAPADIREQLVAVLDAVAASAAKLQAGVNGQELLDLLFDPQIQPAFDAVDKYTCPK